MFPVNYCREQFQALHDDAIIRLDNPAGTQVPNIVAKAISHAIIHYNANLGGAFACSHKAEQVVDKAHQDMADFLGATEANNIIIGPSMTSLNYHISRSIGDAYLKKGDHIIVTTMDHEGNVAPWLQLAEHHGCHVTTINFSMDSWHIEAEALSHAIQDTTKIVALSYANNLFGSINPIKELVAIVKKAKALCVVDAVQYAPHGFCDVSNLGADMLLCSSYKFYGPHLGIAYINTTLQDTLTAYRCRTAPNQGSGKFESGTPQIELLAGLSAAIDYYRNLGYHLNSHTTQPIITALDAMSRYENELAQAMLQGLSTISGINIYGIGTPSNHHNRVSTIAISHNHIASRDIVQYLADNGIYAWSGHNYALGTVTQLGLNNGDGVVRLGITHYNTMHEITRTLESIEHYVTSH